MVFVHRRLDSAGCTFVAAPDRSAENTLAGLVHRQARAGANSGPRPQEMEYGERHSQYIPPQLANGHTMVPARRVAEALGADV